MEEIKNFMKCLGGVLVFFLLMFVAPVFTICTTILFTISLAIYGVVFGDKKF